MAVLKDLIVHGASRFLGDTYFNGINVSNLVATTGNITTLDSNLLRANEAVIKKGLAINFKVSGELETSAWTNSNIAQVEGNFYLSPTTKSNCTVTISGTKGNWSIAASGGSFSSTIPIWDGSTSTTTSWAVGSKVLITGTITINGVDYPLGTCKGILSVAVSSTGFTANTITSKGLDNIYDALGSIPTSGLTGKDIQISLYELSTNGTSTAEADYKPVGIFLTAYGKDKQTYIDIYGGTNKKSTGYTGSTNQTGMARPNVRIGHLVGLPALTVGNTSVTPTGWGIYTDNGYFRGAVFATSGKIGAWKLNANNLESEDSKVGLSVTSTTGYAFWAGNATVASAPFSVKYDGTFKATAGTIGNFTINSALYSNGHSAWNTSANGIYVGSDYISFGSGGVTYFSNAGTGKVGPWILTTSALYNTKSAFNNTNNGVYIGTDGIALGAYDSTSGIASSPFQVNSSGEMVARSGRIGKFSITNTYLITGSGNSAAGIGGNQAFFAGNNVSDSAPFRVSYAGKLVATDAIITGAITASSLTINSNATITDTNGLISNSAIQIGGRNLGRKPNFTSPYIYQGLTFTCNMYDITITGTNTKTDANWGGPAFLVFPSDFLIYPGERYTISSYGNVPSVVYLQINGVNTNGVGYSLVSFYGNGGNKSVVFTVPSNHDSAKPIYSFIGITSTAREINCNFKVKLERGNKATDWSPAPEELDVHKYVTEIDSNGIWVTPSGKKPTNTSTGAGATGTKIDGTGVGIYVGGTKLAQYGTTTYFYEPDGTIAATLDGTGLNIKTGTITLGSNFSVTAAGAITATSGTIGGYSLTANYLQATDGTTGLSVADNSSTASWAFWAGGGTTATAKFRVDHNGNLYATSATITGSIEATSFTAKDYYNSAYRTRAVVDTNGLTIYDGNGTADANIQARFGTTVQVGKKANGYVSIASSGMDIYAGSNNVNLAHFGYNETSSDDPSVSPFYTLGKRKTTTTEYSSSSTYQIGDLCVYNNKLYCCIKNITTAESFTSSHWVVAVGNYSIVEGIENVAIFSGSHAEGYRTKALNNSAHAEGDSSIAKGLVSHAEGILTEALGNYSHAEGYWTEASGHYSHSGGIHTIAQREAQTVIGASNVLDTGGTDVYTCGNYVFIVGNGEVSSITTSPTRSNALAVDWDGNLRIKGQIYVGCNADSTGGTMLTGGGGGSGSGTITSVKTTAGAHTTINISSGAVSFNVPTTAAHVGAVPTSRTVNGKALSSNITLSASDVSALPTGAISYGTTDLTAGSSSLTTGYIYVVYE